MCVRGGGGGGHAPGTPGIWGFRKEDGKRDRSRLFLIRIRVEALLGEKVEIRLLNAVYWVENPI